MHNAEVYIVLLRPTTRAPVLGEAVQLEFTGQVELDLFEWTLHNEKETQDQSDEDGGTDDASSNLLEPVGNSDSRKRQKREKLESDLQRLESGYEKKRDTLLGQLRQGAINDADFSKGDRQLLQSMRRDRASLLGKFQDDLSEAEEDRKSAGEEAVDAALEKQSTKKKKSEEDRNKNFEFTFTKRVDIATTQMLNSMKAGDVFPSGTITIVSRPLTTGMVLTFNVQKIRLLEYALQVETTDTMTHLSEQWTCEFGALAYVYKNRSQTHAAHGAGQKAMTALSQGTLRAFTMRSAGSPL